MPDNLAIRMRPRTIDEIIGQEHLVGEGKIIRRMVEANKLSSMILYGPPGIGKTSIASAIAGTSQYAFRTFNATTDTKKRLQEIAEEAKFSGGLVLLLDEIHRLDKTKQDFLLPLLENDNPNFVAQPWAEFFLQPCLHTADPEVINPASQHLVQFCENHSQWSGCCSSPAQNFLDFLAESFLTCF